MTKISEAWAWMWECGPPAKRSRVIAAARLMTHDYYMLLDGEVSVPWPHHLEELTAAIRALDGEREFASLKEAAEDYGEQRRRMRDALDAGERPPDPLVEFFGWVCICGKEHARDSLPYGIHVCECGYEQAFPTVGYIQTASPDGWPPEHSVGVTTTATSHPFYMDDSVTRTNGVEDDEKPEYGYFEIEQVNNGYVVRIWKGREEQFVLAFERPLGVADEVLRWLGFRVEYYDEVADDEERYVLTDKGRGLHERPTWAEQERARIDALKRGSGRVHMKYPGDPATW